MSFVAYGGISVRRQGVQGLHVHVGMPSAEDCWRCLEAILPWLPVVLALSANSPWYSGELTGMASNRAPVLDELPRAVGRPGSRPTPNGSHGSSARLARRDEDYTRIWWDVRPHPPRHARGARTRPADRRALSSAFAALLQAMCATALDEGCRKAPRCSAIAAAPTTRRTVGRRRVPVRARAAASRRTTVGQASSLGAELIELVRPAARALEASRRSTSSRPASSSGVRLTTSPQAAAADLVDRWRRA